MFYLGFISSPLMYFFRSKIHPGFHIIIIVSLKLLLDFPVSQTFLVSDDSDSSEKYWSGTLYLSLGLSDSFLMISLGLWCRDEGHSSNYSYNILSIILFLYIGKIFQSNQNRIK